MAYLASHAAAFHAASTDTTGEVGGIDNVEWTVNGEQLDITTLDDTTGVHKLMLGLQDLQVTVSGHYNSANAPQALILTSLASGADLYVRWLPTGSAGFKAVTKVQDFKISGSVDGTVQFSATLVGNGAISTV